VRGVCCGHVVVEGEYMHNRYFFPALEPVAVPITNLQAMLGLFKSAVTGRSQVSEKQVVVPFVFDPLINYFKVVEASGSMFNVTLEFIWPGTTLPESATVIKVEYEVPYPITLEERELHRRPDGIFVVSQRKYQAEICIHREFSHRVMNELLNRWICACDLAQIPTRSHNVRATFRAPDLRAFDGFSPNHKQDGISYLRLVT
jgi:hypothetical protein